MIRRLFHRARSPQELSFGPHENGLIGAHGFGVGFSISMEAGTVPLAIGELMNALAERPFK